MRNGNIRVLLVDDHAVVRNGVRCMLGTVSDIEVVAEAESASEAMRMVRQHQIDVALVDIVMPGKNGLELLKQLRAEQPRVAVVMLSMYAEEVYALRALKHGAAGYLDKNCTATALAMAVRKAAAGGKHISRALAEKLVVMIGSGSEMPHEILSDRELDVLKMLAAGESLVKIAEALHLSASTVTTYRARILQKTGMKSNVELARYALESGLLI